MTLLELREVLGWCTLLSFGLLLWWWLFFSFAHDLVYRIHSRWFRISEERFDAIHYAAMAYFKLTIFVFQLVPYLALHIVT